MTLSSIYNVRKTQFQIGNFSKKSTKGENYFNYDENNRIPKIEKEEDFLVEIKKLFYLN